MFDDPLAPCSSLYIQDLWSYKDTKKKTLSCLQSLEFESFYRTGWLGLVGALPLGDWIWEIGPSSGINHAQKRQSGFEDKLPGLHTILAKLPVHMYQYSKPQILFYLALWTTPLKSYWLVLELKITNCLTWFIVARKKIVIWFASEHCYLIDGLDQDRSPHLIVGLTSIGSAFRALTHRQDWHERE